MADGLVHCVEKGGWYPTDGEAPFLEFRENEVPIHKHYSQFYSDPDEK